MQFQKITTNFLDVNLHYAGCIKNSAVIKKSIINRYPVVQENPKSERSSEILNHWRIKHRIAKKNSASTKLNSLLV